MTPFTLNLRGQISSYTTPLVVGILNATPDSFYASSRTSGNDDLIRRACERLIAEGADMIDLGAYSSRPGADVVSESEEIDRLGKALEIMRATGAMEKPVSIDTFRASAARFAIGEMGADIVNDISGGDLDPEMFQTVAELRCPYIMMHMRGTPSTMQQLCDYGPEGVAADVIGSLSEKINRLAALGVNDIILDPGYGFAKTLDQNYELLRDQEMIIKILRRPMLVGVSRKSMLTRLLGITSEEALNATTALNMLALERGAAMLRVHDVKEARQAVAIYNKLHQDCEQQQ